MGDINLNIDRRLKRAVLAIGNPNKATIPELALYDKQKFNIAVWSSTGNMTAPFFETPNLDGYGLRMAISTSGANTAVKALETASWVWDSTEMRFNGTIDLSQSDLVTALTDLAELDMKLEIKLVDPDGNRTTILHEDVTIVRVADIVATPSEAQSDSYYTADEIRQMFVSRRTKSITLVSDDESTEVTLTCDNGNLREQGNAV